MSRMLLTFRQLKNIVNESLLREVSFAHAKAMLDSKNVQKIIKGYNYDRGFPADNELAKQLQTLKAGVLAVVPNDIEDTQKAQAVIWIIRLLKTDSEFLRKVLVNAPENNAISSNLELFYHWQQFVSEKDLMRVKSVDELEQLVEEARPKFNAH